MSVKLPSAVRVAFYEAPAANRLPTQRVFDIFRTLLERGYSVRRTDALDDGAAAGEPHPAVVLGTGTADGRSTFLEIGDRSAADLAARIDSLTNPNPDAAPVPWKPWFPVIDASRCTNCMQCLSFCLFDVYGVTPGAKITVANPANCKTDCPACSRVCPAVAIIFPKYNVGPINGDEVSADDLRREAMKVDISGLLGGNIYSLLRDRSERSKSRFSQERDDERALQERQRCLAKLQQELDALHLPPEVMAGLPSPDQIRQKAEAARQKAQAALAQQAGRGEG